MTQLVAAGFRVTASDGRGHSDSDRATDYANTVIMHDAQALIEQLGLITPHVVGFSMGAHKYSLLRVLSRIWCVV